MIYHPFDDTDEFDRKLVAALMSEVPRIHVSTIVFANSYAESLPDRLTKWIALWKRARPSEALSSNKTLSRDYVDYLSAMIDEEVYGPLLWASDDDLESWEELLLKYRIYLDADDGFLTVLLEHRAAAPISRRGISLEELILLCDQEFSTGSPGSTEACRSLMRDGAGVSDLETAFESLVAANTSPHRLEAVAQMYIKILALFDKRSTIPKVHFRAAEALGVHYDPQSLEWTIAHCQRGREYEHPFHAAMKADEAGARMALAEIGIDPQNNLARALLLIDEARPETCEPDECAALDVNEGAIRVALAERGVNEASNLRLAVSAIRRARQEFSAGSELFGTGCMNEGVALTLAALRGIVLEGEPRSPLLTAISLFDIAKECLPVCSHQWFAVIVNDAKARLTLAETGCDTIRYLRESQKRLEVVERAAQCSPILRGRGLLVAATVRARLGELGDDSQANFKSAREFLLTARNLLPLAGRDHIHSLLIEGNVLCGLSDLGFRDSATIERVKEICRLAEAHCESHPELRPPLRIVQSRLLRHEAEAGTQPAESLRASIMKCESLLADSRLGSIDTASVNVNLAGARCELAALGVDPIANLIQATNAYELVRSSVEKSTQAFAIALRDEATVRRRLAQLGHNAGFNLNKATEYYREAISLFRLGSRDSKAAQMSLASTLLIMAGLRSAEGGELAEALDLVQSLHVDATAEPLLHGMRMLNEAAIRIALAEQRIDEGANLQAALECMAKADPYFEARTESWSALNVHRAKAYEILGHSENAYQVLEGALLALDGIRNELDRESDRIAYLEMRAHQFSAMVKLCCKCVQRQSLDLDRKLWIARAWHWVHRAKSRALLDQLRGVSPENCKYDTRLWDEYRDACVQMAILQRAQLARNVGDLADVRSDSISLKVERDNTLDRLKRLRAEVISDLQATPMPRGAEIVMPDQITEALRKLSVPRAPHTSRGEKAPTTVICEFFCIAPDMVAAFVLSVQSQTMPDLYLIDLPAGHIMNLVNDWVKVIENRHARDLINVEIERVVTGLGLLFGTWLDDALDKSTSELIISPHGLLHLLPLHAAETAHGTLIAQLPIGYLPCSTFATALCDKRPSFNSSALLIGNPTNDLPGAEFEVATIADSLTRGGFTVTQLLGMDANLPAILSEAPRASIIHLACHGVMCEEFSESGFELSDARFTMLDASIALRLPQAGLVFLNGCDSGISRPAAADELTALTRVFMQAGCPTLVANLWPVRDDSSSMFAEAFYESLTSGVALLEAIRSAMLVTRQRYPNLLDWGAFVLQGAWC